MNINIIKSTKYGWNVIKLKIIFIDNRKMRENAVLFCLLAYVKRLIGN